MKGPSLPQDARSTFRGTLGWVWGTSCVTDDPRALYAHIAHTRTLGAIGRP